MRLAAILLPFLLAAQTSKSPVGLPETLAGFSDEATFTVTSGDDRLGTMYGVWKSDGSYSARAELQVAGQTLIRTTTITPDSHGVWSEINCTITVPIRYQREGTTVRLEAAGRTSTLETRARQTLLDNNSPLLYATTVRLYDRVKKGPQQFPVLVIGGGGTDVTLELVETAERSVSGREVSVLRWKYAPGLAELTIYTDPDGRVLLVDVPAQKAFMAREGYESLRKPPEPDPLVSPPTYEVTTEANTGVPMRDGVKLATDLYKPKGLDKAPVILIRTPYSKALFDSRGRFYARRGYVAAVQDCRGRFASPGKWQPFFDEANDGYDTIEWLAAQPFSTGKVGMIGASYGGWVQWWAASARPPHLTTIIPNVAPPDPFYNIPYDSGAFFLWGAIWWADVLESNATADASGAAMSRTYNRKYSQLLRALPVIDLDKAVLGKENAYWRQWIEHPTYDAWWQRAGFLTRLKDARLPVFHQSGWFDGDGIGSKLNYAAMVRSGHPNQKLVLGPWGHTDVALRASGNREFGPAAMMDLPRDYLRWFDYWLKGRDSKILEEPLVQIYLMGSERWLKGNTYPLPGTEYRKLYLASDGSANTSKGGGRLSFTPPPPASKADQYTYDPADPTPYPRMYEEPEESEKQVRSVEERRKEAESYHARVLEQRRDILVYQTEPLAEPLTIAGPLTAVLYTSTTGRDTDWFVSVAEVDEKGKLLWLTPVPGKVRARFRQSLSKPQLLNPGKVYEYAIDLWQTGVTIPKGRRLLVEVASAAFPYFSRNLNTGGMNEKDTRFVAVRQTVYHDAKHASHLLLPVIPAALVEAAR